MRNNLKGFTLIEILVVVAILGVLSSVGVVSYNAYTENVKYAALEENFNTINKSMNAEFSKCLLNGRANIFNSHNCTNSNSPQVASLGTYYNYNLKNPFDTDRGSIYPDPCSMNGIISIKNTSTGVYEVSYVKKDKKLRKASISSTWAPTFSETQFSETNSNCSSSGGSGGSSGSSGGSSGSGGSASAGNPWGERNYRIKVWESATAERYKGIYFGVSGPQYVIMRTRDKSQMAADIPRLKYADGSQVAYVGRSDGFTMYCDSSKGACAKYEADQDLIDYLMKGQCGAPCM